MGSVRSTLAGLSVLALAGLAPASAEPVDRGVGISGSVARVCILGAPDPAAVDMGVLIATSGARVGRIAALGTRNINLPTSYCNYAGTTMTVTANAMLASDIATPIAGFSRAVNFTATANGWATAPAIVTSSATANGSTPAATAAGGLQAAPKIADLTLVLSSFTAPGDSFLVAGGYLGSVVITLGPAPSGP